MTANVFQKPRGEIVSINFDGSFEYGHATWAWAAFGPQHELLGYSYGYIGNHPELTCNVAEYHALNEALRYLKEATVVKRIVVRGDSQLVIRQVTGEYACRSPKLVPLFTEARKTLLNIDVKFEWIKRERNSIADKYAFEAYPAEVKDIIARRGFSYERRG